MVRKNWSPVEENDLLVYLVTSFVWFLENLMLCVTMHHKVPYCAIMVWETCGNVLVIIIKQFFLRKETYGWAKEEVSKDTVLLSRVLQDTLLETPV